MKKPIVLKNGCGHVVDDFFVDDYLKRKNQKDLDIVRVYLMSEL